MSNGKKYVTQASSKNRLQILDWLKSGQVTSRQAIALVWRII
ncbi:MAG: hypothetical protein V7K32_07360 [Nostoc sp.]